MYEVSVLALVCAGGVSEQEDTPAGLTFKGPSEVRLVMDVDLSRRSQVSKRLDRGKTRVGIPE